MKINRDLKSFSRYLVPSIVGMVIAGSFSIIDTVFIGQASGEIGLAAVALTWPLLMLLQAFGSLFGAGGAVLISQRRGAGNRAGGQALFSQTVFLVLFAALILTGTTFPCLKPAMRLLGASEELLPTSLVYSQIMVGGLFFSMYITMCLEVMRNDGRPALAMWLLTAGLFGNVLLDWLFVIRFHFGAAGAAIATIISQGISGVLGTAYFRSRLTELRLTRAALVPDRRLIKEIVMTGIPVFGNMLSIIAMLFMHNMQALRYGAVDGLAAYTAISALESLGSMLMTGIAGGVQPLAAMMYGSGRRRRQNRFGNYGYAAAFVLGVGLMLFSFATHGVIPCWMGLTGEAAQLASRGIVLSATAFLLLGVIRVAGFYYQATGNLAKSSWLIYGDTFIALPLCLYTLPPVLGMDGVWLAMPVSRILLGLLLAYFWFGVKRQPEKFRPTAKQAADCR